MLRVTNTDNLMGIVIHGDYTDLHCLYDTLHRINDFYYDNLKELYSLMKSLDDEPNTISNMEQRREFFMSLNYDIRHAFMGDRNYELKDNNSDSLKDRQYYFTEDSGTYQKYDHLYEMTKNGNLEYSVEILYPLAIFYMYAINDYLNEIFLGEFPDNITVNFKEQFRHYSKNPYTLYQDIGILMLFYGELQEALTEAIGTNSSRHLIAYMSETVHTNNDILYPEALCSYYCSMGKNAPKQIKKAMITVMAYELYDCADEIGIKKMKQSQKDYLSAIDKINSSHEIPYPKYYEFNEKLYSFVSKLPKGFYQEDFDEFLKQEYKDSDEDLGYEVFGTNPWPEEV